LSKLKAVESVAMAVLTGDGSLHALDDGRRVGGGPVAIVQRRGADGPLVHGTCILQKAAETPTPLDLEAPHRLVLADGRAIDVRIVKRSLTSCGPEIVRFEGPGTI
jgi:hypothetical protein